MNELINLIIPRGGKSLIERVQKDSKIPVLSHLDGLCHTFIDKKADKQMSLEIALNAKMRRTGICGATETLLINETGLLFKHLIWILQDLQDAGCEVRIDESFHRKCLDKNGKKFNQEEKIGAIGLRLKNWITYHGLSFNIKPDLKYYEYNKLL